MYRRLKDLREDMDFNQSYVAKYLGVHQTTYSDYERGNLKIPPDALVRLSALYHTSVDYILGLTDEIQPYPTKRVV